MLDEVSFTSMLMLVAVFGNSFKLFVLYENFIVLLVVIDTETVRAKIIPKPIQESTVIYLQQSFL